MVQIVFSISPNGKYLVVCEAAGTTVSVFTVSNAQLSGGTPTTLANALTSPLAAIFSPDSNYLAVLTVNNLVLYSVGTGGTLGGSPKVYNLTKNPNTNVALSAVAMQFTPDGSYIFVVYSDGNILTILNVGNGAVLSSQDVLIKTLGSGTPVQFSIYGLSGIGIKNDMSQFVLTDGADMYLYNICGSSSVRSTGANTGPNTGANTGSKGTGGNTPTGDSVAIVIQSLLLFVIVLLG